MAYNPYQQSGYDQGQAEASQRTSSSGPSPSGAVSQPQSMGTSSVMSLGNLIGPDSRDRGSGDRGSGHDIDRSMLGKLNRRT